MSNITFKPSMFVYSTDTIEVSDNSTINVYIPEVFLDKETFKQMNKDIHIRPKGNIFINNVTPALSATIQIQNYVAMKIRGVTGTINKGDRLLAIFVNNNPKNGIIISRS